MDPHSRGSDVYIFDALSTGGVRFSISQFRNISVCIYIYKYIDSACSISSTNGLSDGNRDTKVVNSKDVAKYWSLYNLPEHSCHLVVKNPVF